MKFSILISVVKISGWFFFSLTAFSRYSLHVIKPTYFKCNLMDFGKYIYSSVNIIIFKLYRVFPLLHKVPSCLILSQLHQLPPVPDNHWSTFCYYIVLLFLAFHINAVIQNLPIHWLDVNHLPADVYIWIISSVLLCIMQITFFCLFVDIGFHFSRVDS